MPTQKPHICNRDGGFSNWNYWIPVVPVLDVIIVTYLIYFQTSAIGLVIKANYPPPMK